MISVYEGKIMYVVICWYFLEALWVIHQNCYSRQGLELTAQAQTWWQLWCSRAMVISVSNTWLVVVGVRCWSLSGRLWWEWAVQRQVGRTACQGVLAVLVRSGREASWPLETRARSFCVKIQFSPAWKRGAASIKQDLRLERLLERNQWRTPFSKLEDRAESYSSWTKGTLQESVVIEFCLIVNSVGCGTRATQPVPDSCKNWSKPAGGCQLVVQGGGGGRFAKI